ncbi:NUDIX hydrolase [Rarobacter incanus]|uniref:8-oxo-dGTP diphosphatase n=1 Tax=Rarobacter incanus TaxID=153494 RepID=A0A542SQL2_9MICO|nr:NUDIX hydrolase [Rarobacter incanus]TQK76899.1 8-oxo-dGTP diphosphatase [Rarobacter incanus]
MAPTAVRVVDMSAEVEQIDTSVAPVVQAAGTLPWRVHKGELQVELIHRPRYRDWSWPKGKLDKAESRPVAAVRETAEETGRPVVLGVPLTGLQYLLADGTVKRAHYWAAQRAGADVPAVAARFPVPPVDPNEIDDRKWMTPEKALAKLSRPSDRLPLETLLDAHRTGTLATRPLIIVRHGKAVDRSRWSGDEATRPLTPFGSGQASALVQLLACYGVQQIVTSPWQRCVSTVEPFAAASGIPLTPLDNITERAHEQTAKSAFDATTALIEGNVGAVLCTHRPVLPTVFDALRQFARAHARRALPRSTPYLQPGACLVAQIADTSAGPRIVTVEKFKPQVW